MRKVGGAVNSAKISRVCLQMLIICPLVEISTIYWKGKSSQICEKCQVRLYYKCLAAFHLRCSVKETQ